MSRLSIVRGRPPPGDLRRVQLRIFQQLVGVLVPMCELPVGEEGTKRRGRRCVWGGVRGENVCRRAELPGDERHEGKRQAAPEGLDGLVQAPVPQSRGGQFLKATQEGATPRANSAPGVPAHGGEHPPSFSFSFFFFSFLFFCAFVSLGPSRLLSPLHLTFVVFFFFWVRWMPFAWREGSFGLL